MNGPLFDDLLDQLRGSPMQRIATDLQLPEQASLDAIATTVRVLLGSLHKRAADPAGAESLLSALHEEHRGIDPGDALGTALAGGAAGSGAILDRLLGEHRQAAAEGIGASAGIGTERGARLLQLMAPVAMAYLARRVFAPRGADGATTPEPTAAGLRDALETEVSAMRSDAAGPSSGFDDGRAADIASSPRVDYDDGLGPLPVQTAEMRSPRPRI